MNYFKLKIDGEKNLSSFIRANMHDGGVTMTGKDGYVYARTRWNVAGLKSKPGVTDDIETVDYATYNARAQECASISSRY
jgi:hypothetical protein